MFFVAALVICLVIKFRFPKGKSIAKINLLSSMLAKMHGHESN